MKKTQLIPIALLSVSAVANAQSASRPPNIILFLVDDMGWEDTSLPFWIQKTHYNEVYETPNMERLAKGGMMFTQAYASSISSPTRCSLITGTNAARHRVTNWTLFKDKTTDRESDVLTLPDWNYNGVAQVSGTNNTFVGTSFVQILKNNGHTKDGKPYAPNAIPGLEKYWGSDTFATEALTQEAIKALDKAKKYNQPFYLYMSHYAIHIPIDKDKRFYQKYIDKGLTAKEAAYAALIEGMDKSLGDLMDWLEKNGEADNTIVIFMSDNGGLSSEPGWRDGEIHTQNYPLNSGKGSAYEGGVREPMIVRWPGVVKPGSKCDKYLIIEDFYPTILEMAGIRGYKTVQPIDGVSFMPLLKGTGDPSVGRSLFWNCPNIWGNDGPGIGPTCSVRNGDWKLIYYYETGRKELFNIPEDIGEHNDVARQHPDIVKRLSGELGTYLRKVDGQRPSFKATGKPVPWPDEI